MNNQVKGSRISEEFAYALQCSRGLHTLQNIFDNMDDFVFWKNSSFVYQGCNLAFACVAGFSHPSEIIGKTDYELLWNKATADIYRKGDHATISGENITDALEPAETSLHSIIVVGKKFIINAHGNA